MLQVRSLANRGDQAAASTLLERLLTDDPQWQPLRSLREQLQASPPAPQAPPVAAPVAAPAPVAEGGFDALLARATARLQAMGQSLPVAAAEPMAAGQGEDLDAYARSLEALERRFSDYEARFALA